MNIHVKPFCTPKGYYVYDRETNSILEVTGDEFIAFLRIQEKSATKQDFEMLCKFQEKGFCMESKLKAIQHPQSDIAKYYLENRIEKITLQVTQNCNLRCSYCAYSDSYFQRSHSNMVMTYDTMVRSVEFLMRHSSNSPTVDIGFYGGEPFLEFENIKKLVEYIMENYPFKEITYSITTNGTIFTDEIISFLEKNDFGVTISIDGPREVHDKNRKFVDGTGSFDTIMKNLQYIKERALEFYRRISFNTVLAPGNDHKCINDFYDASEMLEDNQLFASTLSEFGSKEKIQYDELFYISYNIQRTKMLLAELGMISQEKIPKIVSQEMAFIAHTYDGLGRMYELGGIAHPGGPCIPGAKRPMIDVNGAIFPCERVSESSLAMEIGHIDRGFDMDKVSAVLNIGQLTEDECINCWCFTHCSLCAAAADDSECLSRETKLKYCVGVENGALDKLITICLLKENGYDFSELAR